MILLVMRDLTFKDIIFKNTFFFLFYLEKDEFCGDKAIGFAEMCDTDDYKLYITSGTPDHPAEYNQKEENPNKRCKFKMCKYFIFYVKREVHCPALD